MATTVKEKVLRIGPELKAEIVHSIREVLDDPDFGLKLSAKAKRRLNQARRSPGATIPLTELKRRFRYRG